MTKEEIIELLDLKPLTFEGGYFKETYRSDLTIPFEYTASGHNEQKAASTCIYFFLTPDTFSEFHCLPQDEIYHFYLGDAVELVELCTDGEMRTTILGPDISSGQKLQHVVYRGNYQASYVRPGGEWALLGCTVAPGFDRTDFQKGNWEQLLRTFPKHHQTIMRLTRK